MAPDRKDATFTTNQEAFIVEKFSHGLSPIEVKRAFMKEFGYDHYFRKLEPFRFTKWRQIQIFKIWSGIANFSSIFKNSVAKQNFKTY